MTHEEIDLAMLPGMFFWAWAFACAQAWTRRFA